MSHNSKPSDAEHAAQGIRDVLRATVLPGDVMVLSAPSRADAEAVIDIEVPDEMAVGRVVQVIGPRLDWRTGIVPGTFRATARAGRWLLAVWCTVDESAPVAIPDGAK